MSSKKGAAIKIDNSTLLANMKKNDKYIGDILAPFEKVLGMKFNKFSKQEDPKYIEPKKKANLKAKLKKAEKKQEKLKKLSPEEAKKVHWKNAIEKAQGIKNKEDPNLIKKTIKRKREEKKRHKKKWDERITKAKEAKDIKLKRTEQKKKARKEKVSKKKKSNRR